MEESRKILALDLSTKTGYAIFINGNLEKCDTLFLEKGLKDFSWSYPLNYVRFADYIVDNILDKCRITPPYELVIEETTASQNNYSQKILEFIHYSLIKTLSNNKYCPSISYLRTGVWRSIVGAHQNDEERKWNAKISRIKKRTGQRLAKFEGKVVRKLDKKDYALRAFKDHFGYELEHKMNDACDAALLGLAYIKGAPICDGSIKGGTLKDLEDEHLE